MTKIKLCGLSRDCDITYVNELHPDLIGFVFAKKSHRYVNFEQAAHLRSLLDPSIQAAGVFVNEEPHSVASLLINGTIQIAQLHGKEDEDYMKTLRDLVGNQVSYQIIQAFRVESTEDIMRANQSSADYILLDSGSGGSGTVFDWSLLKDVTRPYFLAGGMNEETLKKALPDLKPYGVDTSSGIETDGFKDYTKMKRFVETVRSLD